MLDLACSVQAVLEENYFALLNAVYQRTGLKRLCLAGGVAFNCAANGKIFEKTPFQQVYIQPAAHDAGNIDWSRALCATPIVEAAPIVRDEACLLRPGVWGG